MRIEGECSDCGSTKGVQVASTIATLMGSNIKDMMDKDGNAMYCAVCEGYHEMENIDIIEDY